LLEKVSDTFGLGLERVEGKQKLVGESGMKWTIDGKGVKTDDGAIVVIECRRYTTSKLKAEDMGAVVFRIADVGAAGGIVVTPIGVQEGGEKIAKHNGIDVVRLNEGATMTDFMMTFLEKVVAGGSAKFGGTGTLTAAIKVVQPDEPGP
jgi:hypothetical protein